MHKFGEVALVRGHLRQTDTYTPIGVAEVFTKKRLKSALSQGRDYSVIACKWFSGQSCMFDLSVPARPCYQIGALLFADSSVILREKTGT